MSSRVKSIESVTLTRLKSNPPQFVAHVTWMAHRGGWSRLRLEPAVGPKDRFLDLELLADWSEVGTQPVEKLQHAFFLGTNETGDLGVRIHALDNAVEARYDPIHQTTFEGGLIDIFPWIRENSEATQMSLNEIVGRPIRLVKPGDVVLPVVVPGRVTIFVDETQRATGVQVEPGLPDE